jgi:hypothetical protein
LLANLMKLTKPLAAPLRESGNHELISIFSSSSAQPAVQLPTDQNRPNHSCDFVGHGDDGAVPGRPSLKPVQPATELVVLSVYPGENHTASINQESTQVGITILADLKKLRFAACSMLPRKQPQPRRQIAALAKRSTVPDCSSQRHCCKGPDAGTSQQAPASIFLLWRMCKLTIDRVNLPLKDLLGRKFANMRATSKYLCNILEMFSCASGFHASA